MTVYEAAGETFKTLKDVELDIISHETVNAETEGQTEWLVQGMKIQEDQ